MTTRLLLACLLTLAFTLTGCDSDSPNDGGDTDSDGGVDAGPGDIDAGDDMDAGPGDTDAGDESDAGVGSDGGADTDGGGDSDAGPGMDGGRDGSIVGMRDAGPGRDGSIVGMRDAGPGRDGGIIGMRDAGPGRDSSIARPDAGGRDSGGSTAGCMVNADCNPLGGMTNYCAKPIMMCGAVGTCMRRPVICPRILDPHCGCDRMTYDNACLAAAAGQNVNRRGPCP